MQAKEKKLVLVGGIILVLVAAAVSVLYFTVWKESGTTDEKNITVQVFYEDSSTNYFAITTRAEYLREALEENGLVSGTTSSFGLFITTVDGVTADDSLQQWWKVEKDGQMTDDSVDRLAIADGDFYVLRLMTGYDE